MNDVICLQCQNGEILLTRSAAESALQLSIDRPSLSTKHASLSNGLYGRHEIATCCDKASVTQRELILLRKANAKHDSSVCPCHMCNKKLHVGLFRFNCRMRTENIRVVVVPHWSWPISATQKNKCMS